MPMQTASPSSRPSRGFTLVELMVVIVILGGLLALVGPNIYRALFQTNRDRAKIQMQLFADALTMYFAANNELPADLKELEAEDPSTGESWIRGGRVPDDPWGNEYKLEVLDKARGRFEIHCSGEDGTLGTDDDLIWPEDDDD